MRHGVLCLVVVFVEGAVEVVTESEDELRVPLGGLLRDDTSEGNGLTPIANKW